MRSMRADNRKNEWSALCGLATTAQYSELWAFYAERVVFVSSELKGTRTG